MERKANKKEFQTNQQGNNTDLPNSIILTCKKCGYTWEYTGIKRRVWCPSCNSFITNKVVEKPTDIYWVKKLQEAEAKVKANPNDGWARFELDVAKNKGHIPLM